MPKITISLAQSLVSAQFPHLAHLPISPVQQGGHDNKTFHLGNDMLIRLPSAECYAEKVEKEQEWLPKLAPHLPLPIPAPLFMGRPSKDYPWNWSVYKWLDGLSANLVPKEDIDLEQIARQLAKFLNALHKIDTKGAMHAGTHNFWRGAHPKVYAAEAFANIEKFKNIIDPVAATDLWERAMATEWYKEPVWIHGDFASGNMEVLSK